MSQNVEEKNEIQITPEIIIAKEVEQTVLSFGEKKWCSIKSLISPPKKIKTIVNWLFYLVYLSELDTNPNYSIKDIVNNVEYSDVRSTQFTKWIKFLKDIKNYSTNGINNLTPKQIHKILDSWKYEFRELAFESLGNLDVNCKFQLKIVVTIVNGIDQIYKSKDFQKSAKGKSLSNQNESKGLKYTSAFTQSPQVNNYLFSNSTKFTPKREESTITPAKDMKAQTMPAKDYSEIMKEDRRGLIGRVREKIGFRSMEKKSVNNKTESLSTYPSFRPKDFKKLNILSVEKLSKNTQGERDSRQYQNQNKRIYDINESILKNRYCKALHQSKSRSKTRNASSTDHIERNIAKVKTNTKIRTKKQLQTKIIRNKSGLTSSQHINVMTVETGASKKFTNILNKSAKKSNSRGDSISPSRKTSNIVSNTKIKEIIRQYRWNYDYCEKERKFIKISYHTSEKSPNYDQQNAMLNQFQRKFEMIPQTDWLELKQSEHMHVAITNLLKFQYYLLYMSEDDKSGIMSIAIQTADLQFRQVKNRMFGSFGKFIQDFKHFTDITLMDLKKGQLIKILESWREFSENLPLTKMIDISFVASHIWVIVDEIADIIQLQLETKFRSSIVIEAEEKPVEPIKEEPKVAAVEQPPQIDYAALRNEEFEARRKKMQLAKSMIIAELTKNQIEIKNTHWCILNSYIDPPEGVTLVTRFLYYIHYLCADDESRNYADLLRLNTITFFEMKKSMLLQNFYKFLMKYDHLVKDTLGKLSIEHMKRIVTQWKIETDRINLTSAEHNTQTLIPFWLTVDNIAMAMYNLVNWEMYLIGKGIEVPKQTQVEREQPKMQKASTSQNYKVSTFNEKLNVTHKPLALHNATVTTFINAEEKETGNVRKSSTDFTRAHLGYNSVLNDEKINVVSNFQENNGYAAKYEIDLGRHNTENSKELIKDEKREDRVFMSETSFTNTYRHSIDNISQRLKMEQELNIFKDQQQMITQQKKKYLDLDVKRQNLLKDMEKIKFEYSFIEKQVSDLQKEEDEIRTENNLLLKSEISNEEWFTEVKQDFAEKMHQVKKLKEEFSLVKNQIERKKNELQKTAEKQTDEKYLGQIEECRNKEMELKTKKEQLYDQLRSLK